MAGTAAKLLCTYAALRRSDKDAAVFAEVDLHLRRVVAHVYVAVFAILNDKHLPINLSGLLDAYLHHAASFRRALLAQSTARHQHVPPVR